MGFQLLDTHAHLVSDDWDRYPPKPFTPDMPTPERTDYTVTAEDLIAMMDANGVTVSCVVQRGHIYGYDNSYILDSAEKFPGRLHPVVILDPQDPETPASYRDMVKNGRARGFRMAQARPWLLDTAWMSSPTAMKIWDVCAEFGTPMTLIVFNNQLPYVNPLIKLIARRYPDLPIILDHGATDYGMSQYEVALKEQAGETVIMPPPPDFGITDTIALFEDVPNINFKITEINMERLVKADARPAEFVRRMADRFGAGRLVWGSDVGQSMLWTYEQKVEMIRCAAGHLSEEEARAVLHDNAARIYGFDSTAR
jgi:predicted TIM-barrel fold metal-dependent hydrolase